MSMHREFCDRCGKPTNNLTIMSMFNDDIICMDCKEAERKRAVFRVDGQCRALKDLLAAAADGESAGFSGAAGLMAEFAKFSVEGAEQIVLKRDPTMCSGIIFLRKAVLSGRKM